ncbi:serine-enriched protein [Gigaspora margarita]|uniref:Serine-enriched protein n=1 Tax=Gigaspora margarita TaxID=4874 RepID=A0A8H4APB0_GIGMA|nr:serine-enriched protein [Gigaspora margarita]
MTTKFLEKLSNNLNELFTNGNEYNVLIEVGKAPNNQVYKAHSNILSSRCPYFKDKLIYDNGNMKKIKVDISVSVRVFDLIIKYIYTGVIALNKVNASVLFDLLISSNTFGLEELVDHIQSLLIYNNALWIQNNFYRICQSIIDNDNFKTLQQFCVNVIAQNPKIIFDHDEFISLPENILIFILNLDNLQIDEGIIWDSIIRWGIAQNPSLLLDPKKWSDNDFLTMKSTLKNCLPLIRYFHISGEDIFEKVSPYQQILDPNLWANIIMKFMPSGEIISSSSSNVFPLSSPTTPITPNYDVTKEVDISTLKRYAKDCLKLKRYDEALSNLNKIVFTEPTNPIALYDRGVAYLMMNGFNKALKDFTKAIELKPDYALAFMNRGETYRVIFIV